MLWTNTLMMLLYCTPHNLRIFVIVFMFYKHSRVLSLNETQVLLLQIGPLNRCSGTFHVSKNLTTNHLKSKMAAILKVLNRQLHFLQ